MKDYIHYIIENDKLTIVNEDVWIREESGVCVFSSEEWEKHDNLNVADFVIQRQDNIHFCKLEMHSKYMFGTFHIPLKNHLEKSNAFAFYILKGKIIFVDDTGIVKENMDIIAKEQKRSGYTLERFLFEFLTLLIDEDLIYLSRIEKEISKIEMNVLSGNLEKFNGMMMTWKKEISRLYRYYSQLADVGERLFDNEMDLFDDGESALFRIFSERAERLQGAIQTLREYAMQIQEAYQSEIGIRQNAVMKVLTIVTTIFLPLTLIAGWYGMNFINMPELQWKYGYPTVMIISAIVIVGSLWIFKRKKFW